MKKITLLLLAFVFGIGMSLAGERVSRNISDLPQAAQNTISRYFPKVGLSHMTIETHAFGGTEYEVILNDGTQIDFDKNGNWTEIERNNREAVPSGLVMKSISDYVARNFKGQKIVQIKKERNKYEIELSNGVDVEFDRSGKFLRYDD